MILAAFGGRNRLHLSVKEAAERFSLSERRIQMLCEEGSIEGAIKTSGVWLIPESASTPKRATAQDQKLSTASQLGIREVAEELSVSQATIRNWIKLGKLNPDMGKNKFSRRYVDAIIHKLSSSSSNKLKRRRNKKYIAGNSAYQNYVSHQGNINAVNKALDLGAVTSERDLLVLLAGFALIEYFQQEHKSNMTAIDLFQAEIDQEFSRLLLDLLGGELPSNEEKLRLQPVLEQQVEFVEGEDLLGFTYISLKDLGVRKKGGIYYTPRRIVEDLIDTLNATKPDSEEMLYLDPCCGSGNFLLSLVSRGVNARRLYGQDLDRTSAMLARISIYLHDKSLSYDMLCKNIRIGNTLTVPPSSQYDIVLGNPPWGSDYDVETLSLCRGLYGTAEKNRPESYDLFLECGLSLLHQDGLLAFVVPEAVLAVKSHSAIREIMLERCDFKSISYIGNVFSGVQCPAIILCVQNGGSGSAVGCAVRKPDCRYTISRPRRLSSSLLQFNTTDEEESCLEALESNVKVVRLRDNARFALGIVTGDNAKYIAQTDEPGYEPIIKGGDIYKYGIVQTDNRILFHPEEYQQVAPVEMYRAKEKLIYRFICDTPVFAYDNKQLLSLNSGNIVIPQIDGIDIRFVLAILNSSAAVFYFSRKFNSVKLLRSHIETLPIPVPPEGVHDCIVDKVSRMLSTNMGDKSLYDEIDENVFDLYRLTDAQRKLIKEAAQKKKLLLFSDDELSN